MAISEEQDPVLCKYYICNATWLDIHPVTSTALEERKCDGTYDCTNTELDESGCEADMFVTTDGVAVERDKVCDDVCDARSCEDEARCDGYENGVWCEAGGRERYVPPWAVCDGLVQCGEGREDEASCEGSNRTCQHFRARRIR